MRCGRAFSSSEVALRIVTRRDALVGLVDVDGLPRHVGFLAEQLEHARGRPAAGKRQRERSSLRDAVAHPFADEVGGPTGDLLLRRERDDLAHRSYRHASNVLGTPVVATVLVATNKYV